MYQLSRHSPLLTKLHIVLDTTCILPDTLKRTYNSSVINLVVRSYDFTCKNNCRKCFVIIWWCIAMILLARITVENVVLSSHVPPSPPAPQTTGNRHRNCPLQINKRTTDNGHTSGYNTARLYTFSCCLYIMSIHQLVTVTALCVIQSRYVTYVMLSCCYSTYCIL